MKQSLKQLFALPPRKATRIRRTFNLLIGLTAAALVILGQFPATPARAAPASAPYVRPAVSLSDSLIAYWKLEEATGTRYDELNGCGGSGCDLTDNNTVSQAGGIIGNAGQFVRANSEYLGVPEHADLSTGDVDFSLATWVYLDSKPGLMYIVGKWGTTEEYAINYDSSNDRFNFWISGATKLVTANNYGSPPTGQWVLIVVWHDALANQIGIQVNNGTANISVTSGTYPADQDSEFSVGARPGVGYWSGHIDSVGFWKKALTSAERTLLYNSGSGCDYPFTACEATPTPTATATFTPTFTPTITLTPAITNTPTDTPTITLTPAITNTPTDTPTITLTPTITNTPTVTNTLAYPYSYIVQLDSGNEMVIERRWTFGEIVTDVLLIMLILLVSGRLIYEVSARWI